MNYALLHVGLGYLRKHLLQSLLLVLGIALGVALVVSVDIANVSADRSLTLSAETLSGGVTHRITGAASGIDETIYTELTVGLGFSDAAPYVEDYVNVIRLDGRPVRLIGIDPLAGLYSAPGENGFFDFSPPGAMTELMTVPGTALVSAELASEAGVRVGDSIRLRYGARSFDVKVAGLIDSGDSNVSESLEGVIVTDITTAQELLHKPGVLTYIDLNLDEEQPGSAKTLERIRQSLPEGVRVETSGSLTESARGMTEAFELNLLALSLLALFVGLFLIYNTVTFSVLERRPVYGTLRSIGVTGRQIMIMVLAETLILGFIGSVIGIALGIILGRGIVGLVTRTINDLYFTLTVTGFSVSSYTIIKGIMLGLCASFLAAAIPSVEASRVMPAGVLRRSQIEGLVIKSIPYLTAFGLGFIGLGALLLYVRDSSLGLSLVSLFLILLGASFLVPFCTSVLMPVFSAIAGRAGVIMRMAPRNVVRSISRTGVAIASLTVAVSVIVSVDIMIGSFRTTVEDWLDYTLNADIFITLPSGNIGSDAGMDPEIRGMVKGFPGIERVAAARRVDLRSDQYGRFILLAVTEDIAVNNRKFLWSEAEGESLWNKVENGSVLISESFAYRNEITPGPGNTVLLPTDEGEREFPVAGVYYDYGSQAGVVLMSDAVYRRNWNDSRITSLAAYVSPGRDVGQTLNGLRSSLEPDYGLVFKSNRALKESAIDTFDRTFTITSALRILVIIVAFVGVLSSLMSLQLERVREFGVLRALGMTVSQMRRLMFVENGIIGLTAGVLSLPLGAALSLILIYVVNLRSFGWTLGFSASPRYFIEALVIAFAAALFAGIYPALRSGREKTAALIREE
jgi:putative ABC transport system permease protein